jgi:probable F420-dependent oxidoreductase
MKIGITLPQFGRYASAEAIGRVAVEAEQLGYQSLWVSERLLWPIQPKNGYGGIPGIPWPEGEAISYDPLEALAYVAAKTTRILLGTAVIDALFHSPVVLAKRIVTVDHLSGGRLLIGLGQGWAEEEFEATNVPMSRRGAGFEEFIGALRACWAPDPVKFAGRFYKIAESRVSPKPLGDGGPPIVVGAYAPAAVERAGRIADGLSPIAPSWSLLEDSIQRFRKAAVQAGRDASRLLTVVCGADYGSWQGADNRPPLNGSLDQIRADLDRMESFGINHVYFGINYENTPLDDQLRRMSQLSSLLS